MADVSFDGHTSLRLERHSVDVEEETERNGITQRKLIDK